MLSKMHVCANTKKVACSKHFTHGIMVFLFMMLVSVPSSIVSSLHKDTTYNAHVQCMI